MQTVRASGEGRMPAPFSGTVGTVLAHGHVLVRVIRMSDQN